VIGFAADTNFAAGSSAHGHTLLFFGVNGWHNLMHLVAGTFGIVSFRARRPARMFALGWGLTAATLAIWGTATSYPVFGLIPADGGDNAFHVIDGSIGLLAWVLSRVRSPAEDDLLRGDTAPRVSAQMVNENARIGMRYAWRDPQPDDGSLHADFWLAPGEHGSPDHVNPLFDEHITIISGIARIRRNKTRWTAGRGEQIVLPAGIPHNVRNAGSDELHVRVELRSGGDYRGFLDAVFDHGGPTTARGLPLNPLRMAVIQQRYPDSIYLARIATGLQRLTIKLLAPVGRLLGYQS
jgi:mannose-6-phosphate isomerase-like protein (cupin superfamily)